jgi:amidophosphoribosyltransferase|tara:strand:- start:13005 stop:14315 length:1311 start_codon:yes stop_codon:yes gene_type:complete
LGLHALQHRGQEGAGIACTDEIKIYSEKGIGLVSDIFDKDKINKLHGNSAIGHVRYSTSGSKNLVNVQPICVTSSAGEMAIAHNGNLTNANKLKAKLENNGAIFQTNSDTEVIIHLISNSKKRKFVDRVIYALGKCEGAFSLLFITKDGIIAARDPKGFRPLMLGNINNSYVIASETCAFDLVEAEPIREIKPGEVLEINHKGITSHNPFPNQRKKSFCIFEHIYFARPDSNIFGSSVYMTRKELGRQLAREHPVKADYVVPVPDSGVASAIGYSEESKIPLELGLLRNHYVGRTFIEPQQHIRNFGVKLKLNSVKDVLKNKKVIVIDDSIVRGTTCRKIIKMIKDAGAKEVHVRISSPPTKDSCYYGIDTPDKTELIANDLSTEQIRRYILADTLGYLTLDGLRNSVQKNSSYNVKNNFCVSCFNSRYPTDIELL